MYKTLEKSSTRLSLKNVVPFIRAYAWSGSTYPWSFSKEYVTEPHEEAYERILTDNEWRTGAWKNCQHYKRWSVSSAYRFAMPLRLTTLGGSFYKTNGFPKADQSFLMQSSHFTNAFGQYGRHVSGLPGLLQVDTGDGFVPRPGNLNALNEAALRALLPTIKAEVSILNTLVELKDFKRLPATLTNIRNFVASLGRSVKRAPRLSLRNRRLRRHFRGIGPTISEALGVSADSYLSYNFGIAPFLDDVVGLYNALRRTKNRINDLLVRQGKRQHKYFTIHVPTNAVDVTSGPVSCSPNGGQFSGTFQVPGYTGTLYSAGAMTWQVVREAIPSKLATFRAQIEFNYHFTQFQTENAQLLGLLDAVGVNLDPSIIWNALPWTFLVDWVVNISSWLGKRKMLNMEPIINITRYSWSWSHSRLVRLRVRTVEGLFQDEWGLPWMYLPDLYETVYRRHVQMPERSLMLASSGLSSRELSLGVALGITQAKRYKPRRF